ncbi:MAG: hypothetical protein HN719_11235 [Alphaproteobacteria bacterium]|nr:hypothetical protein [Alphaproteobacteria bacterium]
MERLIARVIADRIENLTNNHTLIKTADLHGAISIQNKATSFIKKLRGKGPLQYQDLVETIHAQPKTIRIKLDAKHLAKLLDTEPEELSGELVEFAEPWVFKRRGVENKIIVGDPAPQPDQTLIRLLVKAHQWVLDIRSGISLSAIAKAQGVTPSYIRTRSRLAFLSPKIQRIIVKGTFPSEFTTNRILRMKIPRDWRLQDTLFGL